MANRDIIAFLITIDWTNKLNLLIDNFSKKFLTHFKLARYSESLM